MKNEKLYKMLKTECESQIAKAELTLDLLQHSAVGIGDHSTGDFYKNANEKLIISESMDDAAKAAVEGRK